MQTSIWVSYKIDYITWSSITSNQSFDSRIHDFRSEPEVIEYEASVKEENQNALIEKIRLDLQAKELEVEELLEGILKVHNENNSLKVSYWNWNLR